MSRLSRAWTVRDIPPQDGRRVVVTGASSGLGYETALALAGAGAEVVMACRPGAKAEAAASRVLSVHPGASVRLEALDLARLADVAAFAARMQADARPIAVLVNNAGVMAVPTRELTADGFERQLGTNHLGHFALTGRLLPLLRGGRVVAVSSLAASRGARIAFEDLQSERRYAPWLAYRQSKLANLLFALELQRRGVAGGWGVEALAAHPGWSRTDLFTSGPGSGGGRRGLAAIAGVLTGALLPLFGQSAAAGALPQLMAATDPQAVPGSFTGPSGAHELRGPPGPAAMPPAAADRAAAARLWDVSAALTGVGYAG